MTYFTLFLLGYILGILSRRAPRRRSGLTDAWQPPRRDPQPVWSRWSPEIGRAMQRAPKP